jgi:hypothetical protein
MDARNRVPFAIPASRAIVSTEVWAKPRSAQSFRATRGQVAPARLVERVARAGGDRGHDAIVAGQSVILNTALAQRIPP